MTFGPTASVSFLDETPEQYAKREQAAFDRLPYPIRDVLARAPFGYPASEVAHKMKILRISRDTEEQVEEETLNWLIGELVVLGKQDPTFVATGISPMFTQKKDPRQPGRRRRSKQRSSC